MRNLFLAALLVTGCAETTSQDNTANEVADAAPEAKAAAPAPAAAAPATLPVQGTASLGTKVESQSFPNGFIATGTGFGPKHGTLLMALRPVEADGMTSVCGIYQHSSKMSRGIATKLLGDHQVSFGNQSLMHDFSYFARVVDKNALFTGKPNCKLSNVPWNPDFVKGNLELRLRGSGLYRGIR